MDTVYEYIKAFIIGGLLCVIGQLLIDYRRMGTCPTMAR